MICKIYSPLAYAMLIYVIGSIYYLVMTRNIGTPFKDSLTKKQLEIKSKAVQQRKTIFYIGCGIALLLVIIFRPFKKCS
tara:strand:+ start:104 stop:340 length:237 start_codon:yes stop_codon:yes gene_type:complete